MIQKYLTLFKDIEWDTATVGMSQKTITYEKKTIKLVRFTNEFGEDDWCTKSHKGQIVSGTLRVTFYGKIKNYKTGSQLIISEAESHKVEMEKGYISEVILLQDTTS